MTFLVHPLTMTRKGIPFRPPSPRDGLLRSTHEISEGVEEKWRDTRSSLVVSPRLLPLTTALLALPQLVTFYLRTEKRGTWGAEGRRRGAEGGGQIS